MWLSLMSMLTPQKNLLVSGEQIVSRTKKWIANVVISANFCPFAAKAVNQKTVHYEVNHSTNSASCLKGLMQEFLRMDRDSSVETSFLIFSEAVTDFAAYLRLLAKAEKLLLKEGYEGVYQLASFHPDYQFAGSAKDDAANFTNRSIYPMFHLLREESIELALARYPDPDNIPKNNIDFSRKKGFAYMKLLRDSYS